MKVEMLHITPNYEDEIFYSMKIEGISRACLQELVRHDFENAFSVESTRYTLGKYLKKEEPFNDFDNEFDYKRASKYLVWTGVRNVDITSFFMLEDLRSLVKEGISNDKVKYCLSESFKVKLTMTISKRSLQNFLELRTNKAALWEIRELAYEIFNKLPEDHKYLFEDCLYENKDI